jgi:predicted phage tail component-like protein
MSYIILNGVKNTHIEGLMIQALPSISKPQMRTQIETIDGRDGDITTKLGYAAYDKQVLIGLYGNYNIDEVIGYFDSEGTVTFSNEPDKYYHYAIYEQIDFERLIRFRQATVTLHVQPFKYSLSESEIEHSIKSGSEVQVNNSGNIFSKPVLTLTGSNTCEVYLNNSQAFSINLGINDTITIDTNAMEAYSGTTLRNRIVTGGYENLYLPTGVNILKFTGSVTNCIIENYSRWV